MLAILAALTFLPGRIRVDLNQGWQFVRMPPAPNASNLPDAAPTSAWKILSVDSQEVDREDGQAANAIDGNPKTIWHTQWGSKQPGFPHEIVVDLGSEVTTVGLRLLPRQPGPQNGRPKDFSLYLSDIAGSWGTPVASASAPDSSAPFSVRFPAHKARFMRVVFRNGQRTEPFLALSEIGLIRNLDAKAKTDWSSQYNISTVDLGDRRFDLHGQDLEKVKNQELAHAAKWEAATLPHSPWIRSLSTKEIWQGVTYYRRGLDVKPEMKGRRVLLTLEAAMQLSDLWLNGRHIATRRGGYLPLVVDLTGSLNPHNELLVRVDNSDNPLIPPGKPQQDMDFMYGSGLYRNAYLTITGSVYVTDPILENLPRSGGIYVTTPEVGPHRAVIVVRTHVRNSGKTAQSDVDQILSDPKGNVVKRIRSAVPLPMGRDKQLTQSLAIDEPRLWSPDHPNLYTVTTTIWAGGAITDRVDTKIGIRSVVVSRDKGMLLNGEPIRLVGTNRHQDYPWIGVALSDRAQYRDALLIKQSGHNIVRLSHYPQSPAFLDACDELGIMTIPCIPGWQFVNKDPRFKERVLQDIRELIRRDRNHPSAVFWEASLNETYPPNDVAKEWAATAKSESLDGRILTAGDGTLGAPWDIVYNQWRDEDMTRPQSAVPDKPGYIREYGDYEFGGAQSSSRVRYADGAAALMQETWNEVWSLNRYRPQYPWTMGAGTWVMFDHNVPWDFRISACGLADLFRRPKPSFWFFQSQSSKAPMVKIAPQAGDRVVVFSNCDQVGLFANDNLLGRKTPVRGRSTAYREAQPFDGTNTENLAHPPVVFDHVAANAKLEAIGYQSGQIAARDLLVPGGEPARLKVWVDDLGVPLLADGGDVVFVRAAVVDRAGNVVTGASGKVRFTVAGSGSLAGEREVSLEMGVASDLIRSTAKPGAIRVMASWLGLTGLVVTSSR